MVIPSSREIGYRCGADIVTSLPNFEGHRRGSTCPRNIGIATLYNAVRIDRNSIVKATCQNFTNLSCRLRHSLSLMGHIKDGEKQRHKEGRFVEHHDWLIIATCVLGRTILEV